MTIHQDARGNMLDLQPEHNAFALGFKLGVRKYVENAQTLQHMGSNIPMKEILNAECFYVGKEAMIQKLERVAKYAKTPGTIREPLPLPFKTILIESPHAPMLYYANPPHFSNAMCISLMIHERAPGLYTTATWSLLADDKHRGVFSVFKDVDNNDISPHLFALFTEIFTKGQELAVEKTSLVVPYMERGSRKYHEVKRIIHVLPRKAIRDSYAAVTGGKIDWQHSWRVSGHWRKTNTIGKDRTGEYCVEGFTWVKDYVKGNKDLEPIAKMRIITIRDS
jgi:hypothetical protein